MSVGMKGLCSSKNFGPLWVKTDEPKNSNPVRDRSTSIRPVANTIHYPQTLKILIIFLSDRTLKNQKKISDEICNHVEASLVTSNPSLTGMITNLL